MYWFLYKEKQNLKNSQPQPKCTGSYIKKANLNKILYKELKNSQPQPKCTGSYIKKNKILTGCYIKNSQPQPKCTGSYIKKNKILRTANLNPNVLVLI